MRRSSKASRTASLPSSRSSPRGGKRLRATTASILNPTLATRKGTAWAYSSLIFSLPEGAGRAEAGTAGAYLSRSRIAYVNTRGVYGLAGIRSVLFPQTITTGVDYLANGTAMRWWMGGDGQTPALQPGPPITWWWSYANPPGPGRFALADESL